MNATFEIEEIIRITNRGYFVLGRIQESGINCQITENSKLGNVEIEKFMDIPRVLDEKGNQRLDLFAFKLKNRSDKSKLFKGQIVELITE